MQNRAKMCSAEPARGGADYRALRASDKSASEFSDIETPSANAAARAGTARRARARRRDVARW
jgi:hypothetical protein